MLPTQATKNKYISMYLINNRLLGFFANCFLKSFTNPNTSNAGKKHKIKTYINIFKLFYLASLRRPSVSSILDIV